MNHAVSTSSRLSAYRWWTPYVFVLPAFVILATFVLAAMLQVVYYSLTSYNPFGGTQYVGLDNYRRLFQSEKFWWCLLNSFTYLLITPVVMALSLAAAIVVNARLRFTAGWLRVVLFLPVVTPTIVAAVAWRILFDEDAGVINAALGVKIPWLTIYPWTLVTAMIVTLWKGFGYYMMIFLAGLAAIPKELEEAATIDGAGRLGVFRHVVLPGLYPVIALVALISSISAIKVFDELFVTVKGAPITSQTVVPLIFETAFSEGNFGLASAMGVCLFLVLLAFSLVQMRLSGGKK